MMKIGIIGAGTVGGAIAAAIVNCNAARELVLLDIDAKRVRAAAEDLSHAAAFRDAPIKIFAGGYKDFAGADIVVLSAGANQKPGQTRAQESIIIHAHSQLMKTFLMPDTRVIILCPKYWKKPCASKYESSPTCPSQCCVFHGFMGRMIFLRMQH